MVLSCASPVIVNNPCAAENVAETVGKTRRSSGYEAGPLAQRERRDGHAVGPDGRWHHGPHGST